eukprot:scaffold420317_cov15-Prasinocladus_malaysianus.AAC.1
MRFSRDMNAVGGLIIKLLYHNEVSGLQDRYGSANDRQKLTSRGSPCSHDNTLRQRPAVEQDGWMRPYPYGTGTTIIK